MTLYEAAKAFLNESERVTTIVQYRVAVLRETVDALQVKLAEAEQSQQGGDRFNAGLEEAAGIVKQLFESTSDYELDNITLTEWHETLVSHIKMATLKQANPPAPAVAQEPRCTVCGGLIADHIGSQCPTEPYQFQKESATPREVWCKPCANSQHFYCYNGECKCPCKVKPREAAP